MAVSRERTAKFGQLDAADLAGYEAWVRVILGQIMAVSTLPATMSVSSRIIRRRRRAAGRGGQLDGPRGSPSGDVRPRVGTGRPAHDRGPRRTDPNLIDDVRVHWADAATRSVAQEADAVIKLYPAGLLPASYALAKLGYSDDEIEKINTARRAESSATQQVPSTPQGEAENAA